MRKPLPRDAKAQTVRKNGRNVVVRPEYVCVLTQGDHLSALRTSRRIDYFGGSYGVMRYCESDSSLAGPRTSSVRRGTLTTLKSSAYRSIIS